MLRLNALPGEIVKVGHHASNTLPRIDLGVAFEKEPENGDNK